MASSFSIRSLPHYERLASKLTVGHAEFRTVQDRMREILSGDPYNRTRHYAIKKLVGIPQGDGQYRLALGRWRFRYDIFGTAVVLSYYGLRREDTYR